MTRYEYENQLKELFHKDNDLLIETMKSISLYDNGTFEFMNTYDLKEYCNMFDGTNYDLAYNIIHGNVSNTKDRVRCGVSGKLESVSDDDLCKDCLIYMDECIEWILECHDVYDNMIVLDSKIVDILPDGEI